MAEGQAPWWKDEAGDYSTVVDLPAALLPQLQLADVLAGQIAVVRDGLRALGMYDDFASSAAVAIERIASPTARRHVEERGFERLHDVLTPIEAFKVRLLLTMALQDRAIGVARLFASALGRQRSLYAEPHLYVRIMLPEDIVATERELLAAEIGHMVVHNPHRDSWFSHCHNTINLWMAVGPVCPGNSLLLYPDVLRKHLNRDGTTLCRDQVIGVPVRFALDPADIVVFHGEQLHSSELNVTDRTRFVVSVRITYGAPRYGHGIGWVPYHDLRLHGTPLGFASSARARLSPAYARHITRRRSRTRG